MFFTASYTYTHTIHHHTLHYSTLHYITLQYRQTDIQTYTQTGRQTYRHTDIQTFRHSDTDTETYRHTDMQTYRHTDIQTYSHTGIQASRHPGIQTSRHPDIQRYRQTDMQTQTQRHTDIQTYRQTDTHTFTYMHIYTHELMVATKPILSFVGGSYYILWSLNVANWNITIFKNGNSSWTMKITLKSDKSSCDIMCIIYKWAMFSHFHPFSSSQAVKIWHLHRAAGSGGGAEATSFRHGSLGERLQGEDGGRLSLKNGGYVGKTMPRLPSSHHHF